MVPLGQAAPGLGLSLVPEDAGLQPLDSGNFANLAGGGGREGEEGSKALCFTRDS